jgi:hypothetical protein
MRSDELLSELRKRFGEITEVKIDVVDIDDTGEEMRLKGAVVAFTADGKTICSMSIVRMKCVFVAGIYSNLNVGAVIHKTLIRNVPIYFMHTERDGVSLLSVPCEFEDIDLSKFRVVAEGDKPCPFNMTKQCPLYQYKMMIEGTKAGCN